MFSGRQGVAVVSGRPALAPVPLEIDDVVSDSRSGDRDRDFRCGGALADAVLNKPTFHPLTARHR
jgi:hypothetical protein